MKIYSLLIAGLLTVGCFLNSSKAQQPPTPGPEHKKLEALVGEWDAVMSVGGQESKGVAKYKMALGGFWLVSDFKGEVGGGEFLGHGIDGYDVVKKKYTAYWFDSMSTAPLAMEGEYDKSGKILTMVGEGPSLDGTITKLKFVTDYVDKDHHTWTMYGPGPDGKEMPLIEIKYSRKK